MSSSFFVDRRSRESGQLIRARQRGQIVVEYVLLLVVAISIAVILTTLMVSRGDQEGFVITKWKAILQAIASDTADDKVDP